MNGIFISVYMHWEVKKYLKLINFVEANVYKNKHFMAVIPGTTIMMIIIIIINIIVV